MTRLEWDKISERPYETGIDRGVFYIPNPQMVYDNGFAWNGLISVEEQFGDDKSQPSYFDGTKYLDSYSNGNFMAKLEAFTYPDEFMDFEGIEHQGNGLYIDDQSSKVFGMSYRSMIGPIGYKLHLLYNLTAEPDPPNYQNGSGSPEPVNFSWSIYGVPETVSGFRPTCHVIIDSRYFNGQILEALEDVLYGTDFVYGKIDGGFPSASGTGTIDGGSPGDSGTDSIDGSEETILSGANPRLPSITEILDLVYFWNPKLIVAEPSTGLSPLVNGTGDLTQANVPGIYYALPTTRLAKSGVEGLYVLV